MSKKFEELSREFPGMDCRDIARVNWSNKEQTREFYTNPEGRRKHCINLVGETAYALGELLDQADKETQ